MTQPTPRSTDPRSPAALLGADWPRSLDALLDRQAELWGRLDALSQRQDVLIDERDADRLLGLLGERQGVIDDLQECAERLAPFRLHWDALTAALSPKRRADLDRRIDAIARIAAQVEARDKQTRLRLAQVRDELADRLAGVQRGRGAVAAYAPPAAPNRPRFEDRRA